LRLAFLPLVIATGALAQTEAEFTMAHIDSSRDSSAPFAQGETVSITFKIRDKVSGDALEGRNPSAWMDLKNEAITGEPPSCRQVVQRMLNPGVLYGQRIDLNTYYVLVLNDDATVTVVDPRFDYGTARILKLVKLAAPGYDWTLTSGPRPILFVSMPKAGKVAMIDATTWRTIREIAIGPAAGRLGLQPDEHYLWVTYSGGIAAVDTAQGTVAGKLTLPEGPYDIAFDSERHLAFVANQRGGSVSLIDTMALALRRNIHTGPKPVSIAFSSKGQAAYVSDAQTGMVSVVAGARVTTIQLDPGLGQLRFPADGRYGFVLNSAKKLVSVIDTASHRVVHSVATEYPPESIAFTSTLAYLRERGSAVVQMIPLDPMGKEISLAEFPGGQHPLDQMSLATPAAGIVRAPGENSVMVADPKDHAVYFYSEGMAAPMGMFTNASREARALLVLDRTLKETHPGIYQTSTWLERPGVYTVAFLLDSPQAMHCWDVTVEPDPNQPQPKHRQLRIESLISDSVHAGVPFALRFRVREAGTGALQPSASDVSVLATLASWQERKIARPLNDGLYEVRFTLPQEGTYYLHVQSPSLGLGLDARPMTVQVVDSSRP